MSDELLQLADVELLDLAAALRAGRLLIAILDLGHPAFRVAAELAPAMANELQALADRGERLEYIALACELVAQDRRSRKHSTMQWTW